MGPDLNYPDGIETLKQLFDKHDFVERHVNGPVFRDPVDVDFLVTVRDPVKQIVSNYLHILREPASPLHRPATLLSPQSFFFNYGDLLANHQTRYFISAYCELHPDIERQVAWATLLLDCLDKVRWFVPTEAIDEFCMLWQMETGRQMLLPNARINIAESSLNQYKELEAIVAKMPELYSIDLLFWQIARQRYEIYRRDVIRLQINNRYPDNWGCAWSEGEAGIWLGRGWHRPEPIGDGRYAWWAGPERLSEIYVKRKSCYHYIIFSVIVYCGIYEHNIKIINTEGEVLVPNFRRIDDTEVIYVVNLSNLGEEMHLKLRVPEVFSPAMVNLETKDTSRKSVATCKWRLSSVSPLSVVDNLMPDYQNIRNLHAGDGHGET